VSCDAIKADERFRINADTAEVSGTTQPRRVTDEELARVRSKDESVRDACFKEVRNRLIEEGVLITHVHLIFLHFLAPGGHSYPIYAIPASKGNAMTAVRQRFEEVRDRVITQLGAGGFKAFSTDGDPGFAIFIRSVLDLLQQPGAMQWEKTLWAWDVVRGLMAKGGVYMPDLRHLLKCLRYDLCRAVRTFLLPGDDVAFVMPILLESVGGGPLPDLDGQPDGEAERSVPGGPVQVVEGDEDWSQADERSQQRGAQWPCEVLLRLDRRNVSGDSAGGAMHLAL
jgi:hypothetical protein